MFCSMWYENVSQHHCLRASIANYFLEIGDNTLAEKTHREYDQHRMVQDNGYSIPLFIPKIISELTNGEYSATIYYSDNSKPLGHSYFEELLKIKSQQLALFYKKMDIKSMHQELVEGLKSNSYQPVDFDKFNPKPPYIADIENSGPINHYVLVRENDIINDGVVSKLEKEDHISLYIVIRKN
jgi:hypothetical protein